MLHCRKTTGVPNKMLLYQWHEFWRAGMAPYTYFADAGAKMFASQDSWLSSVPGAQRTAAAFELTYRLGKEYEKRLKRDDTDLAQYELTDANNTGARVFMPATFGLHFRF